MFQRWLDEEPDEQRRKALQTCLCQRFMTHGIIWYCLPLLLYHAHCTQHPHTFTTTIRRNHSDKDKTPRALESIEMYWKAVWDRFHHNVMVKKSKTNAGRKNNSLDGWRNERIMWFPSIKKSNAEFLFVLIDFHKKCIQTLKAKLLLMASNLDCQEGLERARACVPFPDLPDDEDEGFDIHADVGSIDGLIRAVVQDGDPLPSVLRCAKALQDGDYDDRLCRIYHTDKAVFMKSLPTGCSGDSANVFPEDLRRAWASLETSVKTIKDEYERRKKLEEQKAAAAAAKAAAEEKAAEQRRLAEAAEARRRQKAKEMEAANNQKKARQAAKKAEEAAEAAQRKAEEAAAAAAKEANDAERRSEALDNELQVSLDTTARAVATVSPVKLPSGKSKGRKRKRLQRSICQSTHTRTFSHPVCVYCCCYY